VRSTVTTFVLAQAALGLTPCSNEPALLFYHASSRELRASKVGWTSSLCFGRSFLAETESLAHFAMLLRDL